LALLAVFTLAACAGGAPAVTVGGTPISVSRYQNRLMTYTDYYCRLYGVYAAPEEFAADIIEQLIIEELSRQAVEANGWDLYTPEINAVMSKFRHSLRALGYSSVTAWLQDIGRSEKSYRQEQAVRVMAGQAVDATEAETLAYYEENKDRYGEPQRVRARHILLEDEAAAAALIASLRERDEAAFAAAAREYSLDPGSAKNGGDLGEFTRGQTVAPFEEAAFSQALGEISPEPVQTEFGYHIILVTGQTAAVPAPYAEMREQVRVDLLERKKQAAAEAFFAELRAKAGVVYGEGYGIYASG
jgi:hypothetical protein